MLLKVALFQAFRYCLIFFSLCWNLYMGVPVGMAASTHHVLMFGWKSGCFNQNFLKRKGFLPGVRVMLMARRIGQ
jgi:hypothetical protein